MLIALSAIVATLGIPFFWRAALLAFGEQVALPAGWILTLYPESLLLGGAAMREPYIITFGALALWGFVDWQFNHSRQAFVMDRSRLGWHVAGFASGGTGDARHSV